MRVAVLSDRENTTAFGKRLIDSERGSECSDRSFVAFEGLTARITKKSGRVRFCFTKDRQSLQTSCEILELTVTVTGQLFKISVAR